MPRMTLAWRSPYFSVMWRVFWGTGCGFQGMRPSLPTKWKQGLFFRRFRSHQRSFILNLQLKTEIRHSTCWLIC